MLLSVLCYQLEQHIVLFRPPGPALAGWADLYILLMYIIMVAHYSASE